MYKTIKTMVLVLALVATSTPVLAQDNEKKQIKREELANKQAGFIASNMAFDDAVSAKFKTLYLQCQKEVWELGSVRRPKDKKEMTEAEAEAFIQATFTHSRKLINIREKYYTEYRKFLTSKQILHVYRLEKQMMDRLAHKKPGKPNRKKK